MIATTTNWSIDQNHSEPTPNSVAPLLRALRARLDLAEQLRATIVRPLAPVVEMPRA